MIADHTGRRYSYPAVVFDFANYTGISDAVAVLRRSGYRVVRIQGARAIMRQHNEYRYICAL